MKSLVILLSILAGVAFLACGYSDSDEDDEDTFVSVKEIKISPDKSEKAGRYRYIHRRRTPM